MDRVSFVKSLEIDYPPVEKGVVCGGSLIAATPKVTTQQVKDVTNSTLLAQLAADKKFSREKETEEWYNYYTRVLGYLGWTLRGFHFTEYESSQRDLRLSQVSLELLGALARGDREIIKALKATIDGLKKSADGVTLFGSNSIKGKVGLFQVSSCTVDKNNQVTVGFLGFYFQVTQSAKEFFFFNWKAHDIHLHCSGEICILDEDVYAQVREEVVKKLGNNAAKKVKNLLTANDSE